jgi:hypothetical protein
LQKGKLVFGTSDLAMECTIQNISAGGASVRFQPGPRVPENVILVHLEEHTAYEAIVAWRKDEGAVGLKFYGKHDLRQAMSPGLKNLRRHCIEYSLR